MAPTVPLSLAFLSEYPNTTVARACLLQVESDMTSASTNTGLQVIDRIKEDFMRRILLIMLVFGALASYALAQAPPPSPGCPVPENYCPAVHQGTTTAFCGYGQCKKGVTSEASGIRVEAPSGEGFPMVWFVSSTGKMTAGNFTFKCELVQQKDRTLVRIPRVVTIPATADAPAKTVKDNIKCGVDLDIGDGQIYHEHFVSNPETQCLGWVECREPKK